MIARDERMQIGSTGNMVTQDWDAAWDSDQEDQPEQKSSPSKNRASIEEERRHSEISTPVVTPLASYVDDQDDAADAWGWGDDDVTIDDPIAEENNAHSTAEMRPSLDRKHTPELRELTLTEPYWTSSLPKPVLNTVIEIYNDGAKLTRPEYVPSTLFSTSTDKTP
jgi:centromere/kinetochore protein ZW10